MARNGGINLNRVEGKMRVSKIGITGGNLSVKSLQELYQEERIKLSPTPCVDSDAIALANAYKRVEKENVKMRYFTVGHNLIKANTKEEAMKEYVSTVADDEGNLTMDMVEITRERALVLFSRGQSEDGKKVSASEILNQFEKEEIATLLVDSFLV